MLTTPLLLTLAACLRPEAGIDRTRVVGTLIVEAQFIEESSEASNSNPNRAEEQDPLFFGYRVWDGTLTGFGYDADLDEPTETTKPLHFWYKELST